MTPLRVAVLGGGRSSEHDVSLASAASVAQGLHRAGHEVRRIEIGRDGVWREDGTVQGLLECLDVPYVGAGVLASALCMDKVVFKELMAQAGIPQVSYRPVRVTSYRSDPEGVLHDLAALGWPQFVKPARLGSSVGIARVAAPEELPAALETAFEHDPLAIVEAAANGLEVECSVIGNGEPVASQPGEILLAAGESGWYDYEAKYTPGGMELIVPAGIPDRVRERVRALAVQTFIKAGCAGLARVDFFVDGGDVLVNELNTIPGFTETSVFGSLFEASGVPYPELLDRLVRLGIERHEAERAHRY